MLPGGETSEQAIITGRNERAADAGSQYQTGSGEYKTKPILMTGVAPAGGPRKVYSQTERSKLVKNADYVADYIKKNNLEIVNATNGQRYVKMPNGKLKNVKLLEIELRDQFNKDLITALREEFSKMTGDFSSVPKYKPDPTTNIRSSRGSINRSNGKYSNRNAETSSTME